jgi:hypothetical protein
MGIGAKIGPGRVSDVTLSLARSIGEVAMNRAMLARESGPRTEVLWQHSPGAAAAKGHRTRPFMTSRIGHRRDRPVATVGGRSGSSSAHSLSVRSLPYRKCSRSCCHRVTAVHMGSLRELGFSLRFHHLLSFKSPLSGFETASNNKIMGVPLRQRFNDLRRL